MHDPAIGPEAVQGGLTNDERYETLAASLNEYGHRCDEKACVRCEKSTSGPPLEGNLRAGDVHDGEGDLTRTVTVRNPRSGKESERTEPRRFGYDAEIAKGGIEAIRRIEHDPGACDKPHCSRCNTVIDSWLQPDYSISKGGGGGSGRSKKAQRPLTGPERVERRIFGGTPFDEGHTSGASVGRPRMGVEARVVRSARIEPRDNITIEASGVDTPDILAGYAAAIRMARNGVSRKIIAAAMLDLVEHAANIPDLPESA